MMHRMLGVGTLQAFNSFLILLNLKNAYLLSSYWPSS